MIAILLIGLLLMGTSVALALRAVAMPRIDPAERLDQIRAYGFATDEHEQAVDRSLRAVIDRLADAVGAALAARLNDFDEAELRNELMQAGQYATPPQRFLGYRGLAAVSVSLLMAWFGLTTGVPPLLALTVIGFGAASGWVVPATVLRKRKEKRYERVERDLPELVDLLVVTVEAGLGFNSSLQVASARMDGPLGDELRLTLQEQRMGLSTNEALSSMLTRCDTPSMRSFVRSILQGETLGVSIGQIMRKLATEMRKRRRQAAEEKAQKAPVKLLFPLVFFIFPPIFIVLLFPALYQFMQSFGAGV